jgi:hypothetical protein
MAETCGKTLKNLKGGERIGIIKSISGQDFRGL